MTTKSKSKEMVTFSCRMSFENAETLSAMLSMDEQSENAQVRHVAQVTQRAVQRGLFVAISNRKP